MHTYIHNIILNTKYESLIQSKYFHGAKVHEFRDAALEPYCMNELFARSIACCAVQH